MTKNHINILFTSSGRRVELVRHFKKTLDDNNITSTIMTADLKDTSPASKIADKHFLVPRVTDKTYITSLIEICSKEKVDILIPLIDTELITLAENKLLFEDVGTTVLISSVKTHEICNDKVLTADFFEKNNFEMPKVFKIEEMLNKTDLMNTLLIKPAKGSSGIGVYKVHNKEQLNFFSKYLQEPILQEYIEGNEYTVDVYTDFSGKVLTAVPRLRIETRAGEVSKGKTIYNEKIVTEATKVVEALPGAFGCITVQCFLTVDNNIKFIEINPRFGGGAPLSLEAGADYALYLAEMIIDGKSKVNLNNWRRNLLMLRYDAAFFIEED